MRFRRIVANLSHPLFNATGVSLMLPQLNSKRLEPLREILPNISRVAVIANRLHPAPSPLSAALYRGENLGTRLIRLRRA
jgi:hypothetical protein